MIKNFFQKAIDKDIYVMIRYPCQRELTQKRPKQEAKKMYEFKGMDKEGFAIYEDATEKTAEQIEAEKTFEEWLRNYEANRKAQ